jgi:multidrug efflux pump subunit AcrA (membrane-fusion protein)
VLVTVQIESPDARLKPGMTASCDFVVDKADDALYLPSRAVQQSGGSHFVTVLRDGKPVQVAVQVGLQGEDRTEILEGLSEGTEVVLPSLTGQSQPSDDSTRPPGPPGPPGGAGGFLRGG